MLPKAMVVMMHLKKLLEVITPEVINKTMLLMMEVNQWKKKNMTKVTWMIKDLVWINMEVIKEVTKVVMVEEEDMEVEEVTVVEAKEEAEMKI